ncbi:hypothetical protein QE152_g26786 [Popillia japonica]|uniref:Uncharacterized protein n=1 Tax=Popillia japonica TaxID=7064 RepID=A0AAW1JVU0_POPJA
MKRLIIVYTAKYDCRRNFNIDDFNQIHIDSGSTVNKITPKPFDKLETSTIPLEGLFQTESSLKYHHNIKSDNEILQGEHSRFVNVRILEQDIADPSAKWNPDAKYIPIKILRNEEEITMKADVVEVTPENKHQTIKIAPIKKPTQPFRNHSHLKRNFTLSITPSPINSIPARFTSTRPSTRRKYTPHTTTQIENQDSITDTTSKIFSSTESIRNHYFRHKFNTRTPTVQISTTKADRLSPNSQQSYQSSDTTSQQFTESGLNYESEVPIRLYEIQEAVTRRKQSSSNSITDTTSKIFSSTESIRNHYFRHKFNTRTPTVQISTTKADRLSPNSQQSYQSSDTTSQQFTESGLNYESEVPIRLYEIQEAVTRRKQSSSTPRFKLSFAKTSTTSPLSKLSSTVKVTTPFPLTTQRIILRKPPQELSERPANSNTRKTTSSHRENDFAGLLVNLPSQNGNWKSYWLGIYMPKEFKLRSSWWNM